MEEEVKSSCTNNLTSLFPFILYPRPSTTFTPQFSFPVFKLLCFPTSFVTSLICFSNRFFFLKSVDYITVFSDVTIFCVSNVIANNSNANAVTHRYTLKSCWKNTKTKCANRLAVLWGEFTFVKLQASISGHLSYIWSSKLEILKSWLQSCSHSYSLSTIPCMVLTHAS